MTASKSPRLYLKSVPLYAHATSPRDYVVVAYEDAEGKREYHRFSKRPRFGCRRVRIPCGKFGTMNEDWQCEWITRTADAVKEATHRYPVEVLLGPGYFGDGMRYIVAVKDSAALAFAKAQGVSITLEHLQSKNKCGNWTFATGGRRA